MIIDLCESQSSQPQLEDEIDDGVTIVKSSSTSKVMDKVTVVFDAADDEDYDNVVIVRSSSPLETRGTIDQGKTALYSSSSSSRQAIQILSAPASSSLSSSSTSSRDNVIVLAESISNDPLADVIKVFPDADPIYCQTLLTQNGDDSGVVLSLMAENGYKKYVLRTERNRETPPAINFDAIDEAMSDLYQQNSLQQLGNDFPFLYAAGIRLVAKKHNYHYKPVLDLLEQRLSFPAHEYRITWQHGAPSSSSSSSGISRRLLTNPAMQPSDAAIAAMTPALHALCLKVKTNKFTREAPYNLLGRMDARFEQELDYVESLRKKAKEQRDREKAEEVAFEQAQKEGSLVECGCCFSEFVFEKIVACTEGHLFCCGCLNHFVEQTVFGDGKSKLNCITTQGKCEGWFVDAMIVKSVSDKTYKKLQDALASDALKQAQIDNIVSCHVCAYACELGDGAGSILKCPACGAETCKHCGDVSHIPLRCEEVEKKGAQDVRTRVEEAMTKARVRECPNPKCKARFFKVEGCNKMTCTCGWKICYICRLNITKEGYAHFCQQAHCTHASCNKCVLFTDTIEDDRRAMKDAGLSTLNATQNGEAIAASSMEPAKVRTASGQDLTGAAAITALLEARPRGGQGAQPQVQAHPPPLPRVPPPHGYFHMPDGYQILPGGHRRNKRRRQV